MVKFLLSVAVVLTSAFTSTLAQSGPWPTAPSFYPQTNRKTLVLNGTWSFGWAPNGTDAALIGYSQLVTPETTFVPSSFDVAPAAIPGPRTTVFYRSTHACTPGVSSLARFYAVNFYARVFSDGLELGNHTAGPFTPFSFTLPPCGAGATRELALIVNNEFNSTLSPTAIDGDFFFYSGIIRPIVISELPLRNAVFIDRVEPLTINVSAKTMDLRVYVSGGASNSKSVNLSVTINGAPLANGNFPILNASSNVAVVRVTLPADVAPWSLGHGNLFELSTTATDSGDTWTTRSGLRIVSVDTSGAQARLALNGEIVKLHGFNRHTMWPDTGAAVTLEQEAIDVALIVSINANYIRGGHYPQSQSFLDALDAAGVAVWEESLGPGVSTKDTLNPYFMTQQIIAMESMIHTSFSHPSVILHGFFNEGPSSDVDACPGYATLAATVAANVGTPPARLSTWASDNTQMDMCYAFADVISFNDYPGWYGSPGDISDAAATWKGHANWIAATWPGKPFTVSETGGGGIYEWVNATSPAPGPFWSTQFQTALVSADAGYLLGDDRVSGVSLWVLTDFKVDEGVCGQCDYAPHPDSLTFPWDCAFINTSCYRPNGMNHKGAVDWWRRPKSEFAVVQALYGAAKN